MKLDFYCYFYCYFCFYEVCVFYLTNEMQLTQCSLLLSALYMLRAFFSAHHQELIKTVCAALVLLCFPAVYCWCGSVGTAQLHQR